MNRWDPEHIIESDEALEIIQNQFPELNAQHITFLGAGFDNTAYVINNEYIFRFPRRSNSVPLLQNEVYILPKIATYLPNPISAPQLIGKPTDNFPWFFAGYKKLPGKSACHLNLSDTDRTALAKPLAKFLSKLHAIPVSEEYKRTLPDDTNIKLSKTVIIPRIQKNLALIESYNLLENKTKLYDMLEKLQNVRPPQSVCIVHGDFYVRHILVDEKKPHLTGIIDWGDVHIGDPAVDISIAHSFLPSQAHHIFREAYGKMSDETWQLAKLRGFYIATVLVEYGYNINDSMLISEGRRGLRYMAEFIISSTSTPSRHLL